MPLLTKEQLQAILIRLPEHDVERYLPLILAAMSQYEINTPARVAAFIAQLAHESAEFRHFMEYASGEEYDPEVNPHLAARLGNTQPGDGPRYKGRGAIQITGRDNYAAVSRALGVDFVAHPEKLAWPEFAFHSAAWWWKRHGLNELADQGLFREITIRINGGVNGLAQREAYYAKAQSVLALLPPSGLALAEGQ